MTTAQAKHNMLRQQIFADTVTNEKVLKIIDETPREFFVPESYKSIAFASTYIPLPCAQVMMLPNEEARLLQALNIQRQETILEIGTGSGYLTALLSKLGQHVESVDLYPELTQYAQEKLSAKSIENIRLITGDASEDWSLHAPYDIIVITGSMPLLPKSYLMTLAIGGRLFAILGSAPVMTATLVTRMAEDLWEDQSLFDTMLPSLINAPTPNPFVF